MNPIFFYRHFMLKFGRNYLHIKTRITILVIFLYLKSIHGYTKRLDYIRYYI